VPSLGELLHRFRRRGLPPGAPGWAVAVPAPAPDVAEEVADLRSALDALADEAVRLVAARRAAADRLEQDAVASADRIAAAARDRAERDAARILTDAAAAADAEAAAILRDAREAANGFRGRARAREDRLVERLLECVLEGRP
jgi:hypothetical protein